MVNLVFLSLQRHIFSAKLEMWRWAQPRTDLHLLQEAPLPLHTQCLHQHRPEKTNSPQRKRSLIVNWNITVGVWCSPSLLLLQLPPLLPPPSYWRDKIQQCSQKSTTSFYFFLPSFLLSSVHHLLFFLVVTVSSCQVVHGDSQEDVQQDVWCSLRMLMFSQVTTHKTTKMIFTLSTITQ